MGNKKRCDNPFERHGVRVEGQRIPELELKKAASLHPNFDWSLVRNLCLGCRNKAIGLKISVKSESYSDTEDQLPGGSDTHNEENFEVMNQDEDVFQNEDFDNEETINVTQSQESATSIQSSSQQSTQSNASASCSNPSQSSQSSHSSQQSYIQAAKKDDELEALNLILESCGLETISKSSLYKPYELRNAYRAICSKIGDTIEKLFAGESALELERHRGCSFCDLLLFQMSEKFKITKKSSDRYKILTSLPGRYTAKEVQEATGCSKYMSLLAFQLKHERGVCSGPDPRQGNKIPEEIKELVRRFYLNSANSRPSPRGYNDALKGPNGSVIMKHHMLVNQRDLFALFQGEYPDKKIGRTSFFTLCPRECVWPGNAPFHNVCLCVICQNMKQLYKALKREKDFKEFLRDVFCFPLKAECSFCLCEDCPKLDKISELFDQLNDDDTIQFKEWTRQDGTNYEFLSLPVVEFAQKFENALKRFIEHYFIKEKQNAHISYLKKEGLKAMSTPTLLIQVDFAQNYTMVIQDSVYGVHWSKRQATVHPFSATWWDSASNDLKEKNYVLISDTMDHNTNTFNCFKRKTLTRIMADLAEFDPKHIIYLSDGCAGQYKNKKNMAHLMKHYDEYGMTAEWIFTASYHGKGPCDRVAGTVKRTTRNHSLTPGVIITTADQMMNFCIRKLQSDTLVFMYMEDEEIKAEEEKFNEIYEEFPRAIPGTRTFHHFIPLENGKILLRKYSGSAEEQIFSFGADLTPLVDPNEFEITNFYIFVEAFTTQVGMLVDYDNDEVEFQSMKMNKGNKRCRWPALSVTCRVTRYDVLLHISEPVYNPNGYFELLPEELCAMQERFKIYKQRQ